MGVHVYLSGSDFAFHNKLAKQGSSDSDDLGMLTDVSPLSSK